MIYGFYAFQDCCFVPRLYLSLNLTNHLMHFEVFSFFLINQILDLDESICCADLNSLSFIRSSSSHKEVNRLFQECL